MIREIKQFLKDIKSLWEKKDDAIEIIKYKRTRKKGRFVADDLSTKEINEAWVGGKAPKKKRSKKRGTKKRTTKRKNTKRN